MAEDRSVHPAALRVASDLRGILLRVVAGGELGPRQAPRRDRERFYASHQRAGRKLPLLDSLLAATALRHQLTIVTRNTADFPDDVPVLDPWTA